MKKSLSLLLAIALVFSMFGSLAYAADDLTAQQKYDALKEKGIFAGMADGSAGLDQNMNRAQFARVAALILGLDGIGATDTKVVTEAPFSDTPLGAWYIEEVAAAKEANLMVGNGDGTFSPTEDIQVQQLAVVVAKLLGLEEVEGAEVEGAASYAAPYIQALLDAGIDYPTNYTEPAKRELLVSLAFTANAVINPETPEEQGIASAAVVGAHKVAVNFHHAVDGDKATFSAKKGSIAANIKEVTYSDDKKTATLEFSTKITAGDYEITVAGLGDTSLSVTVAAEDEKVAKVEFTSLNAVLDRDEADIVTAKYVVENQYGEKINDTALTASSGKGSPAASGGTLTIDADGVNFTRDEKVNVSLLHSGSNSFASGVLIVVDPARVADIAITELWNEDGNTPEAGNDGEDFYLLLDVKDQYGNSMDDLDNINDDVVVSASSTNVIGGTFDQDPGNPFKKANDKVALQLPSTNDLTAGTSKVTIVSKTTGRLASFDVVVKETSKVDIITLSQPTVLAAGDGEIEVPFTAVDQFGAEVTNLSTLQNTVTLTVSPLPDGSTNGDVIYFKRDHVKGVNKLIINGEDLEEGTIVVTAVANGKPVLLTISVKAEATPKVVSNIKDFARVYAIGATDVLERGDVVVHDQYGREITPELGSGNGNYQIAVTTSAANRVELSGDTTNATDTVYGLNANGASVTFEGKAAGTSTITVKLVTVNTGGGNTTDVAGSAFTFTARVVGKADIASYEVADIATIHDNGAHYAKDLVVNGVLANGDKVKLPDSFFTVSTSHDDVSYDDTTGKIVAVDTGEDEPFDVSVVVVINGQTQQTVIKSVKIDPNPPVATALSLQDATGITKEDDNTISVSLGSVALANKDDIDDAVVAAIKVTDQYGTNLLPALTDANYPIINVSNISNDKTVTTLAAGDTFDVTAVTSNAKSISFKVIVNE